MDLEKQIELLNEKIETVETRAFYSDNVIEELRSQIRKQKDDIQHLSARTTLLEKNIALAFKRMDGQHDYVDKWFDFLEGWRKVIVDIQRDHTDKLHLTYYKVFPEVTDLNEALDRIVEMQKSLPPSRK